MGLRLRSCAFVELLPFGARALPKTHSACSTACLFIVPALCSFSSSIAPGKQEDSTLVHAPQPVVTVPLCGLCLTALPQGTQSPRSQGDSPLMVSLKASSYLVGSV